jgi:hypothetical protein
LETVVEVVELDWSLLDDLGKDHNEVGKSVKLLLVS